MEHKKATNLLYQFRGDRFLLGFPELCRGASVYLKRNPYRFAANLS